MADSDYLENALLDGVLGGPAYSLPASVTVHLYTVAPTDAGGGTEVAGGSYAAVSVTNNSTNFPAASGGAKSNGTEIDFGTPTADWGEVVAVAIKDGANYLKWGLLTTPKECDLGNPVVFAVGDLDFTHG